MTFPVLDPSLEGFDCLFVLCATLGFVDLIGDAFGGSSAFLEFFIISAIGFGTGFNKRL